MNWKEEYKPFLLIFGLFIFCFYLPVGQERFDNALMEALYLVKWYAREHVILCLIPAFFIAGAISVFVSQASVMKYLGARANKVLAYSVASVSGTVLAVCSCTVLPLFAGIYRMGAGIGPATAFLYAGPAVNALAIILTARILGLELGVARAVGAVLFSIVIGIIMHLLFRKEEAEKVQAQMAMPEPEVSRPLWQNIVYFGLMIAVLVFANWGSPDREEGFFYLVYQSKWVITSIAAIVLAVVLVKFFNLSVLKIFLVCMASAVIAFIFPGTPLLVFGTAVLGLSIITATAGGENGEWFSATWGFTKQITPLLLGGIIAAGLLLGRPGNEGIIPNEWIAGLVGGNSLGANFFASVVGAFMYFATLTEVPILQGLIGSGMGKGPALALLLAGPALSLPNMLVINSVIGTKKTTIYCTLVIIMAMVSGMLYGQIST